MININKNAQGNPKIDKSTLLGIKRKKIFKRRKTKRNIAKKYFLNNIKEYSIVVIIFIIGVFLGVMFINNTSEENKIELGNYINNYIQNFKETEDINYFELTKISIQKNIFLAIILWFAGTTIIGIPIVLGIILFRGGCLGYTIAICISTLGIQNGLSFVLITLFLQNIIFIPALVSIGVSSINLYKAIVRDRKKETIKFQIIKHTLFSILMLMCLVASAIIEINVSCKILQSFIKYF